MGRSCSRPLSVSDTRYSGRRLALQPRHLRQPRPSTGLRLSTHKSPLQAPVQERLVPHWLRSTELNAHPAHTEHDHRRNEPGDDRAADHESVGECLADTVRHHDPTRAGRKMREDEECAEPIMRYEADIPGVVDETGGRARREAPSGVDAKICPCEYEDRVHVAQHVKGEVDA